MHLHKLTKQVARALPYPSFLAQEQLQQHRDGTGPSLHDCSRTGVLTNRCRFLGTSIQAMCGGLGIAFGSRHGWGARLRSAGRPSICLSTCASGSTIWLHVAAAFHARLVRAYSVDSQMPKLALRSGVMMLMRVGCMRGLSSHMAPVCILPFSHVITIAIRFTASLPGMILQQLIHVSICLCMHLAVCPFAHQCLLIHPCMQISNRSTSTQFICATCLHAHAP